VSTCSELCIVVLEGLEGQLSFYDICIFKSRVFFFWITDFTTPLLVDIVSGKTIGDGKCDPWTFCLHYILIIQFIS
jgi:hypothetical protein